MVCSRRKLAVLRGANWKARRKLAGRFQQTIRHNIFSRRKLVGRLVLISGFGCLIYPIVYRVDNQVLIKE